jgi:hypothetical protein
MRRRDFILAISGVIAAASAPRPSDAFAQAEKKLRQIGVLVGLSESDPEPQALLAVKGSR